MQSHSENQSRPPAALLRLLIVEDSEIDAQLMVHHLHEFGYATVWDCVDDLVALQVALSRQSWDIALCDYTLPRFSGLEALTTIRLTAPDLPVILVSGTIGEEVAVEAMRAGAYDYLLKDRLTRLGAAVQRSLQEAEQRQARRQTEDQLRLLFHAIEHSTATIVITDTAGRIEYANPHFTHVTGYPLDAVRGKNPRILKSDRMPAAEYARLWKTVQAGGEWRGEFCNRKSTGELFWESAAISPVRDRDGRITHFVKVGEDITHRKQADETFRKLDAQLRQAQKTEVLGELAGGIAHDFNSFLGAIVTNLQLARSGIDADSQTAEYLDRATVASRQAAGLARQMLSLSRRGEPCRRYIQLAPVVLDTVRLLDASLPQGVKTAVDIGSAKQVVLSDAAQIQQVLVNLWTNACHAVEGHGKRIAVCLADIDVGSEAAGKHAGINPGSYVRLTVRDDGRGMSPDVQERIFEPFFSTKPEGKGTGLGLSVVQSIVHSHQGAVAVESRPDQGTSVHLFFPGHPSSKAEAVAAVSAAEKSVPRGNGEHVMLVDDHALVQDATRNLLEHLGYRATVFGSPLKALAAFRESAEDYDLVLTDLSMREMNGAELAREILAVRPTIPIVVSSGYELGGIRTLIRELGIREVLAKPVERDRMAATLARALGRSADFQGRPAAAVAAPIACQTNHLNSTIEAH
jgi:PAS domain S-box-containing protein